MKKIILFIILVILGSGLFIYSSKRNADMFSLKDISKLNVLIIFEEGVKRKDIVEDFDEIEKLLNELEMKKIESDSIIGTNLVINGYNQNNEEKLVINISGNYLEFNKEYYICDQEGMDNLVTYFKEKIND